MARKPKLRVIFDLDVAYLLRLKQAVEDDPAWPEEFRLDLSQKLWALATYLMHAPARGSEV